MRDFRYLFPPLSADYRGSRFSFWFLVFITALSTARSLVHIFAPDGGANSIAGIDVDVEGGDNVIDDDTAEKFFTIAIEKVHLMGVPTSEDSPRYVEQTVKRRIH